MSIMAKVKSGETSTHELAIIIYNYGKDLIAIKDFLTADDYDNLKGIQLKAIEQWLNDKCYSEELEV